MSTVDEQSPSSEIVAGGVTRGMLTGLFASAPPCRCGCSLNDHHYKDLYLPCSRCDCTHYRERSQTPHM